MATVARENIGLLNDKIIVKVNKEDYLPTFEKKLKEYSKTVNMPGFRKGMVPAGLIKKMYGPSIYTDEVLKTVEKQLHSYLDTEKPDIFAQPIALDTDIRKLDVNNPDEYEFGFEIGLRPAFELPPLEKGNFTLHKVEITKDLIDEEVDRLRIKGGEQVEQELADNEDQVLTILLTECDENGVPVTDGLQKEQKLSLKDFTKHGQEQLFGKKVEDSVVLRLSEAFIGDKLASVLRDFNLQKDQEAVADKYFQFKILKIVLLEKRQMNETFFSEIFPDGSVKTEDDFRAKIAEEFQQYWGTQSKAQLQDQLYHYLIDNTKIDFPEEFLKRWLQTGREEHKTAEEAEKEFPEFSHQLKWSLISEKITKDNNLEVSVEEVKASMKREILNYFGRMPMGDDIEWLDSYVERMLKDEKQVDSTYRKLITQKLFDHLQSQVTLEEKEISVEKLLEIQHHHSH